MIRLSVSRYYLIQMYVALCASISYFLYGAIVIMVFSKICSYARNRAKELLFCGCFILVMRICFLNIFMCYFLIFFVGYFMKIYMNTFLILERYLKRTFFRIVLCLVVLACCVGASAKVLYLLIRCNDYELLNTFVLISYSFVGYLLIVLSKNSGGVKKILETVSVLFNYSYAIYVFQLMIIGLASCKVYLANNGCFLPIGVSVIVSIITVFCVLVFTLVYELTVGKIISKITRKI